MSVKTVLVPLVGSDHTCDTTALDSALTVASRLKAYVDALHVRLDPRSAAAFVGEGMTSAMIESVIDMAEKDSRARRQTALNLFNKTTEKLDKALDGKVNFVERQGNREDVLLNYGRLCDLIVVCKNANEENTSNEMVINAALLETGRPVLVVDSPITKEFGKNVAVIWNGSAESSRAITHALPILKDADKVTLICAVDDLDDELHSEEAIRYLERHGIAASACEIRGSSGRTTADLLMSQAEKCGADFLVMGAYTRSRLRRLFFGAVTGEILEKCKLPVLMAH
ncbi:universal stress protein [Sneathiella aquimaris]|uniref:universal stress protein n=1 Tax=Sneathiella aquimaris TaxID=2599305 RepID=UPI00146A5B3E|nr:universal stress protein [Sneathiella aquimaris]